MMESKGDLMNKSEEMTECDNGNEIMNLYGGL